MFDRMWNKANWETEEKVTGIGPWQAMASTGENDDTVTVKGNFDQPQFLEVAARLQDWKNRGFWSKNAVVNTQNNTESFQAGKSALATMNVNTAKSLYASIMEEHPEWGHPRFRCPGRHPRGNQFLYCQRNEHFLQIQTPRQSPHGPGLPQKR